MSPPEKAQGPAAHRTPKTATTTNQPDDNTPGFWRLANTGKVRPFARENEITHYECPDRRWSA